MLRLTTSKNKTIDLAKLDKEISQKLGWKRHSKASDTDCYSGLTMHTETVNGVTQKIITVIWTQDGVNGFPVGSVLSGKKETSLERELVLETIGLHNG